MAMFVRSSLLMLVSACLWGQAKYVVPKTPWGDPDLQGTWPATDLIGVPVQRAASLGTRNVLNDEEFAQRQQQADRAAQGDTEEFRPTGAKAGINPPGYWLDRGKPQRIGSLIVDPPDGRMPALTKEAEAAAKARTELAKTRGAADSYTDRTYYDRCISRGVLGSILPVIYNNGNQIVQAPGVIAFRNEMIHETRIIKMDGSPHADARIKSYMGDARGHWEGSTLVVDTTNFVGNTNGIGLNGNGTPHSDALHLTERFTRTGPNTLLYQAVVDDPKTWTKPWKIEMPLARDDGYEIFEYACHEGNYAMHNLLSAARSEEKGSK